MTHDGDVTRRTAETRPGGRGARVVARVQSATIDELGRVGYRAMRVEDVAAPAQVSKTTVYRRWPTKVDLVTAAMADRASRRLPLDTGSLREDLRRALLVPFELDATELGMLRVVQQERAVPDVDALARGLRANQRAIRMTMVQRGFAALLWCRPRGCPIRAAAPTSLESGRQPRREPRTLGRGLRSPHLRPAQQGLRRAPRV